MVLDIRKRLVDFTHFFDFCGTQLIHDFVIRESRRVYTIPFQELVMQTLNIVQ
ncbi:Uncharacterised protein [Klebsiella pneumoniae]|nr:Uncharacterised protein [Klebsiella pneumoniae]